MPEPASIIDIAEAGKARRGRGRPRKNPTPGPEAAVLEHGVDNVLTPEAEAVLDLAREAGEAGVAPDPATEPDGDTEEDRDADDLEASAAAGRMLYSNDADVPPLTGQAEIGDQGEAEQLDLSDLIAADVLITRDVRPYALTSIQPEDGLSPEGDLVRSVKRQGVRVPVLLAHAGPGRYGVVDGSRRVAAARKVGLLDVPGLVIPLQVTDPRVQALRVTLNRVRHENVPAEARSVWEMLRDGAEETAIQDATELPLSVVRKRAEVWGKLLPALREEFALGKVQANVAERASTLPHDTQAKLLEILKREGRLTMKDVKHFIDGEEVREQVSFLASKDPAKKATKALEEGATFARAAGWERSEWMQAAQDAYSEAEENVPLGGAGTE